MCVQGLRVKWRRLSYGLKTPIVVVLYFAIRFCMYCYVTQCKVTSNKKASHFLLSILPKRGPKAFEKFLRALVKLGSNELAKTLDPELTSKLENEGKDKLFLCLVTLLSCNTRRDLSNVHDVYVTPSIFRCPFECFLEFALKRAKIHSFLIQL